MKKLASKIHNSDSGGVSEDDRDANGVLAMIQEKARFFCKDE